MGFTTPCFMVVEDIKQAIRIVESLMRIGDRKPIDASDEVSFPCFCAVSTNMVSFGNMNGLASAGFTDCGKKESLLLALSALTNNNDYWMQWLVKDDVSVKTNWSFNMSDEISPLAIELGYRRATAEELVSYLQTE